MEAANERLTVLTDYRDVSQQLVDLFTHADEFVDLDALNRLMAERDQLIERYNQLAGEPTADERQVAAEIERLDAVVMASMRDKLHASREKSSGIQLQRRGHSAYNSDYAYQSAFIDKRK